VTPDPAIEEIRRVRHEISAAFGHDLKKLGAHYLELQKQFRDRLVSYDPEETIAPQLPGDDDSLRASLEPQGESSELRPEYNESVLATGVRGKYSERYTRGGDGIDFGLLTGERFGRFVFWLVTQHSGDRYPDKVLEKLLRDEFPNREATHGPKTFQSIAAYRSYAKNSPERLGIRTEAVAAEVLRRLDRKKP
jgi:hypothetical protein